MVDWKDKACIVTGACSGIGLEFVKSLLAREAKCLMADLNFKVGEEKEKEFQDQYGEDKVAYSVLPNKRVSPIKRVQWNFDR